MPSKSPRHRWKQFKQHQRWEWKEEGVEDLTELVTLLRSII